MTELRFPIAVAAALVIVGCSSTPTEEQKYEAIGDNAPSPTTGQAIAATVTPGREFDEDGARDAAIEWASGETYQSNGGGCSGECTGHEAGWSWAIDHDLTDGCDGDNGEAFNQGCQAYADVIQQHVDDAEERFKGGDDTFLKRDAADE